MSTRVAVRTGKKTWGALEDRRGSVAAGHGGLGHGRPRASTDRRRRRRQPGRRLRRRHDRQRLGDAVERQPGPERDGELERARRLPWHRAEAQRDVRRPHRQHGRAAAGQQLLVAVREHARRVPHARHGRRQRDPATGGQHHVQQPRCAAGAGARHAQHADQRGEPRADRPERARRHPDPLGRPPRGRAPAERARSPPLHDLLPAPPVLAGGRGQRAHHRHAHRRRRDGRRAMRTRTPPTASRSTRA